MSGAAPPPAYPHGATLEELHSLMLKLAEVARRDELEYETHGDEHRAAFCDGGATRLKWVVEELRKLAGLPCEWRKALEPACVEDHDWHGALLGTAATKVRS